MNKKKNELHNYEKVSFFFLVEKNYTENFFLLHYI